MSNIDRLPPYTASCTSYWTPTRDEREIVEEEARMIAENPDLLADLILYKNNRELAEAIADLALKERFVAPKFEAVCSAIIEHAGSYVLERAKNTALMEAF